MIPDDPPDPVGMSGRRRPRVRAAGAPPDRVRAATAPPDRLRAPILPQDPGQADEAPTFLSMVGLVALVVAVVILVFFGIGYLFGRLFL